MQNYTEKVVNLWNKCVDEFAEANGITDVPDFNFAGGEEATEQDFQDAADTFLSEALEEIIADATYEMLGDEAFVEKVCSSDPSLASAIIDSIKNALRKIRDMLAQVGGFTPKYNRQLLSQIDVLSEAEELWLNGLATARLNAAAAGNVNEENRHSVRENFANEIDEWDRQGRPDGVRFVLGSTGDTLQGLGAIENDIYINSDKINVIFDEHPEMTIDIIKRIPEIIDTPIAILKSRGVKVDKNKNTRMVMFGSVQSHKGPVMAVLDLIPIENHIVVDNMQKVVSSYAKDNNPKEFVENRVLKNMLGWLQKCSHSF